MAPEGRKGVHPRLPHPPYHVGWAVFMDEARHMMELTYRRLGRGSGCDADCNLCYFSLIFSLARLLRVISDVSVATRLEFYLRYFIFADFVME